MIQSQYELPYKQSPNQGQCVIRNIYPIQYSPFRYYIYVIFSIILFAGFPFLIVFWFPWLKRKIYYRFCHLQEATHFFIKNYDNEQTYAQKKIEDYYPYSQAVQVQAVKVISFVNRHMKYIIQDNVAKAVSFDFKSKIRNIMNNQIIGLDQIWIKRLNATYGPGNMVIQRPSIPALFLEEVFTPLSLFILFSFSLWIYQKYYYYAGIILLASVVAIVINLLQVRKQNKKIFDMANYSIPVNVLREDKVLNISSVDIVPGDIVFLKNQDKIPFEGIILEGSASFNQCVLTGQSAPRVKKADLFQYYLSQSHQINKSSFVHAGTTLIQVYNKKKMQKFEKWRQTYGIPVCVIGTNFNTLNGKLVRINLFPKLHQNPFQWQLTKFLIFLFILAVIIYGILIIKIHETVQTTIIIQKILDLITIAVPPGLSISMTCGIIFAIRKLKEKNIFCASPNKLISGGRVNSACFDKTGTLTQDYMDFYGLVPVNSQNFQTFIQAVLQHQNVSKPKVQYLQKKPYLLKALGNMASNHSIIQIQNTDKKVDEKIEEKVDDKASKVVGDPMQIKLFQFGEFKLDLSHNDPDVLFSFSCTRNHNGIIYKRFQFDFYRDQIRIIEWIIEWGYSNWIIQIYCGIFILIKQIIGRQK